MSTNRPQHLSEGKWAELTPMQKLEASMKECELIGYKYVAMLIKMPNTKHPEIIINPRDNFASKLDYIKEVYDEGLKHKYSEGVQIIDFIFGEDSFEDINELLY